MFSAIISRLIILFCGILYPAYASYKAVRTKSVKEYVKWMMYWIVFAFFTFAETITDVFLSWFPFYYEIKVLLVIWLLSPVTKGSSVLYRKFVHPMLIRHEEDIEDYLNQAKEKGYSAVLQLGSKGVNYATNVIMQTAIKGGGNLVQTIKRSYSLSDLSEPDILKDEIDNIIGQPERFLRPKNKVLRSSSGSRHSTGMYFTEIDVNSKNPSEVSYNVRSSEDISSGYSSAEPISSGLSRTSSMTNSSRARLKSKRIEDPVIQAFFEDTNDLNNENDIISLVNFCNGSQPTAYVAPGTPIFYENQYRKYFESKLFDYSIKPEFQFVEIINKSHQLMDCLEPSHFLKNELLNEDLQLTDDNDFYESLSENSTETMEDFEDAKEAEVSEIKEQVVEIESNENLTNKETCGTTASNESIYQNDKKTENKELSKDKLTNAEDYKIQYGNNATTDETCIASSPFVSKTSKSNYDNIFKHVLVIDSCDEDQSKKGSSNELKNLNTEEFKSPVLSHNKGKAPDPPILTKQILTKSALNNDEVLSLPVQFKKSRIFKILPSKLCSDVDHQSLKTLDKKSAKTILKETEI